MLKLVHLKPIQRFEYLVNKITKEDAQTLGSHETDSTTGCHSATFGNRFTSLF